VIYDILLGVPFSLACVYGVDLCPKRFKLQELEMSVTSSRGQSCFGEFENKKY